MLSRPKNRKGQAFSVDVLLALMPLMMILGAGLQYLYLAEEDMKDINQRTMTENILESFTDSAFYEKDFKIMDSGCTLKSAFSISSLPGGYKYHVTVIDQSSNNLLCNGDDIWSTGGNSVTPIILKNTMSSETRFTVQYDDVTGEIIPGEFAEVSIAVWEDI